jgi:L-alanine-DL-glutamate epimerase-like enolase superfamily enzyme
VRWALSGLGEDEVVQDATDHIAVGHRALKLKMGALDPDEDVHRVARLLDKIGEDLDYLADPNGSWDYRTAVWAIRELEAIGVRAVEQPLERTDLNGMAELGKHTNRIRLLADESVCRPADAIAVTRRRACDAVAVKPGKSGGLRRAAQVAAITDAAGMSCYGGTALESSLGTAAAAQLFASMDQLEMGCELIGPLLLADDLVVKPLSYQDGNLHLPDGPGLGVEVDWDRVARYARSTR